MMMEPEIQNESTLQRSISNTSAVSSTRGKSETVRMKPRKHPSSISSATTNNTTIDNSLTSFPSLAPESPPPPGSSKDLTVTTPKNAVQPKSVSPTPKQRFKASTTTIDSLTVPTPQRTALFDEPPLGGGPSRVPGALHHTTDEHIERVVAKVGVITLVRQLAEDVALRDAQLTAARRRADGRERELRKMLLGLDVSNMDIEARLRAAAAAEEEQKTALEGGRTRKNQSTEAAETDTINSASGGSIDEMMNEAMNDAVGLDDDALSPGLTMKPTLPDGDMRSSRESLLAAAEKGSKIKGGRNKQGERRGTVRGWRDYIWPTAEPGQKTSRANSVAEGQSNGDSDTNRPVTRRASSTNIASKRKGLGELFDPVPERGTEQGKSRDGSIRDEESSASPSVASWALRLVAGNGSNGHLPTEERRGSSSRSAAKKSSRASSVADGSMPPPTIRTTSNHGTGSASNSNAVAALARAGGRSVGPISARRATAASTTGPNGTVKGQAGSSASLAMGSSPTNMEISAATDSGPVEMDTILPPESQPPTLSQFNPYSSGSEYITDRFGFIYDQRRSKRQKEAAEGLAKSGTNAVETISPGRGGSSQAEDTNENETAVKSEDEVDSLKAGSFRDSRPDTPMSGESKPPSKRLSRWQDYLKVATFPTELLLHTPSAPVIEGTDPDTARKAVNAITVAERGSMPSASPAPEPEASNIVSEQATIVRSGGGSALDLASVVAKDPQPEPVKLLLEQLTELHDSTQHEKTIKWNEFLRKVRAERQREGEAAAAAASDGKKGTSFMPEVSLTDGEVVGVAGLGNKGKVGRAKWQEFKHLVLGGIPVAYRAKIWAECSEASALRVPGYYDDLVMQTDSPSDPSESDSVVRSQISMDINRTLTDNIFFRRGPGVRKLHEVLLAYSRRNTAVGYCQGMNLITASLLLIVPSAEDAFWLLATMIETILPASYYDDSLLASRADQQVLRQYVAEILPRLSAHLETLEIELEALTFQWFLSVFTDCLSAEALFRVWDVVLCTHRDGSTFLFQVALALLKLNEGSLLTCQSPARVYSYISHNMTNHAISIDGLIQASDALRGVVKRDDVEARREKVIEAERETLRLREEIVAGSGRGEGDEMEFRQPLSIDEEIDVA